MASSKSKTSSTAFKLYNVDEIKKAAGVLRGLNHKIRQDILEALESNKGITVTEVYKKLKKEQSLTSSYLAILRRASIIIANKEGQIVRYSVDRDRLAEITKGAKLIDGSK